MPEPPEVGFIGLLPQEVAASGEIILGESTVVAGAQVPLHTHDHSEVLFLLEGAATVQRDRAVVELHAPSAAYIPANAYHSITALDNRGCRMLLAYPRGDLAQVCTTVAEGGVDLSSRPNPNVITAQNRLFRWAVAEDFEPSVGVEPSKGLRLTARYLLDPRRGCPDVVAGTFQQQANVHYTLHRHAPPEIYYVLEGAGLLYVADKAIRVSAGSTVYLPPSVTHGIDTFEQPLRIFWMYGLDRSGPDWTWEAVEDVYDIPPGSRHHA